MRWVAALVIMATVASARAHGGPPMPFQIEFAADDPHSLYATTSYGLVISHDDGCTFEWVCESNVGYGGFYIPKIRVSRDGAIFATTSQGLRVSRDGGCSFTNATSTSVQGLDIGPTGEVWIATAQTGASNDVLVSRDNGQTFTPTGLASSTIYWHSVAVAPGDPTRVYASGYEIGDVVHLRRLDGDQWVTVPATGIAVGSPGRLVIAAIAPHDPDILYVVSTDARVPSGDVLYRSEDGGMTFTEVFSVAGLMRDVVVRDAQTVIVTSMLVMGPAFYGGPPSVSTDGGRTFGPHTTAPDLACLSVAPDGSLVGCGSPLPPDPVGITRLDGSAWTTMWRFAELSAPLACAPGTGGHDSCDGQWADIDVILQTSGPTCGAHIRDDGIPGVPPPDETCCSATIHPTSWAWVLAVAWQLGRRRRRQPPK